MAALFLCPAYSGRTLSSSHAFFASAMRVSEEGGGPPPSFKKNSTTSCPICVSRAIVPPQPYSGSPGCPPQTTTLIFLPPLAGVSAPAPRLAASAVAPPTNPPPPSANAPLAAKNSRLEFFVISAPQNDATV